MLGVCQGPPAKGAALKTLSGGRNLSTGAVKENQTDQVRGGGDLKK